MTIHDGSTRKIRVKWRHQSRMMKQWNGFEHDGNSVYIVGWFFCWEGHDLYPSIIEGKPDN